MRFLLHSLYNRRKIAVCGPWSITYSLFLVAATNHNNTNTTTNNTHHDDNGNNVNTYYNDSY